MTKTLNTLALEVMGEFGESTGNAALVTQFERWVQKSYEAVGRTVVWPFFRNDEKLSTVATQAVYEIAANAFAITAMRIISPEKVITYRSREDLIGEFGVDMERTATDPDHWYFVGHNQANGTNEIGLWPIPTTTTANKIEIIEFGQSVELLTTDKIPVPTEFFGLIKLGAIASAHANEKDWDGYDRAFAEFNGALALAVRRYAHNRGARRRFAVVDAPRTSTPFVRFPPSQFGN